MSRAALAQRPPDAPLISRSVSKQLQASLVVRFEPDVVRARPPPPDLERPTLPAYLQPKPPPAAAAKPPSAAADAKAAVKPDKDAKDGKDAKDAKDKAAAGKGKADGKDAAGAGSRDAKGTDKARGGKGKGAAPPQARKAAAGHGQSEDGDGSADGANLEEAIADTGLVELERPQVTLSDPDNAFDGPTELTTRPQTKADAPKDKPDPDLATYAAVFAEAAAAARRLHDELIADAQNAADAARGAASSAADRRQSELDRSLRGLDDGLDAARSQLASLANDAASLVDQRANEAEQAIRRAAGAAKSALAATNAKVVKKKAPEEAREAQINASANAHRSEVDGAGGAVNARMTAFKGKPESVYPYPGGALPDAINEAIVTRAPPRAEHRLKAYKDELTAQQAAMAFSYGRLPDAFKSAFQTVNGWVEQTSKQGPAAVDQAVASSLKQLAAMRRQMQTSIRTGRARTDAALARQHNAARAQTIAAHKTRSKTEAGVESRRAEQDITGLRALAIAQGASVRVLTDGFAKEADRDEKSFAKAVVTASRGFLARVAAAEGGQRPRLVTSAANNRAVSDGQSRTAGEGLVRSAEAIAAQLGVAAKDSGDGLFAKANETSSSYAKLAEPVSKSIQSIVPPIERAMTEQIDKLHKAVEATGKSVEDYFTNGQANESGGGGKGAGGGAGGGAEGAKAPEPPPKMKPTEYAGKAREVAGDPKKDVQIHDLEVTAKPEIGKKINDKSMAVWTHIGAFHVETDAVLSALRAITQRQGAAIKDDFRTAHGQDIEPFIRLNMPKTFSTYTTNKNNVEAAISYLNGNNVEGALHELKAAVNWSNENARVEAVARSLTPAQWAELKALHPDDVKDVRDDLDGVNKEIFKALESEGDAASMRSKGLADPGITKDSGQGVAKANALRLRQQIDDAREKRGDAGADKVADQVEAMATSAGTDVISGADPIRELEEHPIDALDTADPARERNKKQWEDTKQSFDKLELARDGGPTAAPAGAKSGWSIAAYASQKRDYDVYVSDLPPDAYGGDPYGGEYGGQYGHWETKTEGISDNQTRLIQNIVDFGPDSDEAAAARVMVELNRDGGKPKPERLDKAMHSSDLDAHEGEDRSKLKPDEKQRRLDAARERQQRVLDLVSQYKHPGVYGPADPEAVRKEVTDQLTTAEAGDPSAKALVERTMRGPEKTWEGEDVERRKDARVAFDYALAHESERGDTLKRTFGRMDRDEIDKSVQEWNDDPAHKGQDPLYNQLNLFGKGSWWTEKLSGDERNDVELAAMGVARNTKERAEIARFRAEQQIRDAGFLGKLAGKVTGDWDRLVASRDKIEELMGVPHGSFDALGRATGESAFDADGKLKPANADRSAQLEVAMNMTHLTADAYKTMTDSLATAVTTGLVVIAAVVTTALTGGAAASIWIPVLVTAAAGLTGMALSAAIKGNRYSRAEMERDLVMTFVQAATAGLGAAAGVAIKGGMPALRAVVTEAAVSEKVLEGVAEAAGRQAMSKGWTLVAEMGVQAGSNAINSAAGAAMDPTNRARGESGDKAFEAGIKGLFSGAVGGLLMKPAGALGGKAFGAYGQRAVGNVVSSVGQRATEIGYDAATGERRMEGYEIVDELKGAGAQALVQSTLEHGAAHYGDARQARAAARRGGAPGGEHEGGQHPPGGAARPGAAPEEHPGGRPPSEAEPGAARPGGAAPVEPGARAPPEPEPPIVLPFDSDMAPVIGAAEKLRPPELPPIAAGPTETAARPSEPPATEPVTPATRDRPGEEGAKTPSAAGRADEAGSPERKPQAEEKTPSGKKRPPPLPLAAIKDAPPDFFEGGVMVDPDSKNRAAVEATYHETIKADPSREVAIYRNPATGEHILVFGNQKEGFIETRRGGVDVREAPMPGGSSRKQEFKDFLPADIGHWELEAHYHPTQVGMHDEAPMARRLPSAGTEGKGDFGALKWESRRGGGQARESVIHFFDQGRTVETVFGFDPKAKNGEVYSVSVENPATGKRETHRFVDIPAYEKWASQFDVRPSADLAAGPGHTPATREAPADESFTLRHGASEAAAANIAATGIDPHRSKGTADDFSRGFYTTLDEPNAGEYALRGARQRGETTAEGAPGAGSVVSVDVKLSELGQVVDVRPGGEHHDAWQEFLDRKPPPSPPVPRLPYWETAREYGLNRGKFPLNELQRGAVFEAFLQEKGLGEADAIRGGLGVDPWTHGISAQPGEQIVIRSKRLANTLNERLGFPLIPDEPAPPRTRESGGSAPEREAPALPPTRGGAPELIQDLPGQGHDHPALRGLPDPFPEWQEPKREPFPAPETEEESATRQKVRREVDEKGIRAFMEARKGELQALRALSPEADKVVMRAIRDSATPREVHEAALRELLAREGVPTKEIDAHAQTLREFLTPVGQQLNEFRAAVINETFAPDDVPAEIQKWKDRDAAGKPNKVSLDRRKAEVVAAFAKSLTERDAQNRLTHGSVGDFIAAAHEFEAWKGKVAGLDAEARAALPRQIDVEALERFRALDETKETHSDRDALKRLDSTRETKALATEILIKATGDPGQVFDLLIEWGTARHDSPRLIDELVDLATVLATPEDAAGSRSELVRRLQEARIAQADLKISSQNVEAMALADPVLLQLAATNREQFIERYVSMMRDDKYQGRVMDTAAFRADVDKAIRGGEGSLSTASEATAAFHVAKRMQLEVLKAEATSPTGRTNESGIDIVAFKHRTDAEYLWQEPVAVHLFDDKAVGNPLIGDVTALTDNLADNLDKAVARARDGIAKNYPGGRPFDPDVEPALKQMEDAAKAIRTIDKSKVAKGAPGSGSKPYQQIGYAQEVAKILRDNNITLHITTEYGNVMEMKDWLKAYGFRLWDYEPTIDWPGPNPEAPPLPPAPPPGPPPTP